MGPVRFEYDPVGSSVLMAEAVGCEPVEEGDVLNTIEPEAADDDEEEDDDDEDEEEEEEVFTVRGRVKREEGEFSMTRSSRSSSVWRMSFSASIHWAIMS